MVAVPHQSQRVGSVLGGGAPGGDGHDGPGARTDVDVPLPGRKRRERELNCRVRCALRGVRRVPTGADAEAGEARRRAGGGRALPRGAGGERTACVRAAGEGYVTSRCVSCGMREGKGCLSLFLIDLHTHTHVHAKHRAAGRMAGPATRSRHDARPHLRPADMAVNFFRVFLHPRVEGFRFLLCRNSFIIHKTRSLPTKSRVLRERCWPPTTTAATDGQSQDSGDGDGSPWVFPGHADEGSMGRRTTRTHTHLLYVHTGGLEGLASQLGRYRRLGLLTQEEEEEWLGPGEGV